MCKLASFPIILFISSVFLIGIMSTDLSANDLAVQSAEDCVPKGGFNSKKYSNDAEQTTCIVSGTTAVYSKEQAQKNIEKSGKVRATSIANPAASHCVAVGGEYGLETSICKLPNGAKVNAWILLRQTRNKSITSTNPEANNCANAQKEPQTHISGDVN